MTESIRMLDLLLISQPEFLQIKPISDVDVKGGIRDVANSSFPPQKPEILNPQNWWFRLMFLLFKWGCFQVPAVSFLGVYISNHEQDDFLTDYDYFDDNYIQLLWVLSLDLSFSCSSLVSSSMPMTVLVVFLACHFWRGQVWHQRLVLTHSTLVCWSALWPHASRNMQPGESLR